MKRILFLLSFLLAFTAIQAQVVLPKGVIVGTGATKATLDADELKTIDGATSNLQTQLDGKAASANVYTKAQSDALVAPKANSTDVYTKAASDAITSLKANSADVYLKTQTYTQAETNSLISPKADASAVYTKTEVNSLVTPKADAASVYTKTEVNNLVSPKANASEVYTKAQADAITALKADKSATFTKAQVDSIADLKQSISDSISLRSVVYMKAEVDAALLLKANLSNVYTKSEVDAKVVASTFMNPIMMQMIELSVPVKAVPMFSTILLGGSNVMTDGRLNAVAYRIKDTISVTGVKYTLGTMGDYTEDNYNGVVLYAVSGTTLTEVTRTADDGTFWKKTANTIQTKDFPAPVELLPGFYIVASVWNASATVTAPSVNAFGSVTNSSGWTPGGMRLSGYLATPNPAASYVFGDFTNYSQLWGIWLY